MRNRTSTYSYCNLNFRVIAEHAKIVADAAALRNESMSSFMRRVILEWAAAELKLDAPDLSEYAGDIIAAAAKASGLTPAEFTRQAARESAARLLRGEHDNAEVVGRLSTELQQRLRSSPSPAMIDQNGSGERRAVGTRRR